MPFKSEEVRKAYFERWREEHPDYDRKRWVKRKYGIELSDVSDTCEACGINGKIQVDHDHGTNKVRGFLCSACNRIIGLAKDNPNRLVMLARYITKHNWNLTTEEMKEVDEFNVDVDSFLPKIGGEDE